MPKPKKIKVLVADESLTVQKQVNVALASTNYEVITASDGQDALQKAKTLKPDLVLADCGLRHIDGFDLVERIRADSGLLRTRAILLKGQIPKGKDQRFKEVKSDAVLSKPFDQKALVKCVNEALLDEESTAINPEEIADQEDKTPIVKVHSDPRTGKAEKIDVLNSKLQAIAEEVVGPKKIMEADEGDRDPEEVTQKVHPKEFRMPVHTEASATQAQTIVPSTASLDTEGVVREEVRKWLSENMPQLVEKLIKDELFKLTKGSA